MLFSWKVLKNNKILFFSLTVENRFQRNLSSISILWLKKTSFLISKGFFNYNTKAFKIKNLIIEISFIFLLKFLRMKKNFFHLNTKLNEFLRLFCN